jgi:hypothetical protein
VQAAADQHHVRRREAEHRTQLTAALGAGARLCEVVLHVAGDMQARCRNTERSQPLRVLRRLHREQRKLRQHARHQPRAGVNAERLRGHLAVDQRRRHPAAMRDPEQIRPELRFGDDQQARVETVKEARDDERQVRRQRDDAVSRVQPTRGREARPRKRGNDERRVGMVALERGDQRA